MSDHRWIPIFGESRSLHWDLESAMVLDHGPADNTAKMAYPKVYVKISRTAKLSIPNLEGHRHLVIFMERLVEAFPSVCC